MNDENFEKNDFSANVNDFGIIKRDSRTYTEYTWHPEMVQEYNFDCCVDTDDENGIFMENEIDKENVKFFGRGR